MENFKTFISEVKSPGWYTALHRKQKGIKEKIINSFPTNKVF